MARKPHIDDEEWAESFFNDPRQIPMDFAVHPEDDFDTFHSKNPQIWRDFRKLVLETFNQGGREINLNAIIKEVTGGVSLKPEISDRYWKLFISNHQEMEHVLRLVITPDPASP